jgi:hypothetical protein
MKTNKLFVISVLIATLSLSSAGRMTAQTFASLHGFSSGDSHLLGRGRATLCMGGRSGQMTMVWVTARF